MRDLFLGGSFFQNSDEAQQPGNRKCSGQQSHRLIRTNGGYEAVDEKKLRWSGHCRGRPRNYLAGKLFPKQKWEQREHGEENQIPDQNQVQRLLCIGGI